MSAHNCYCDESYYQTTLSSFLKRVSSCADPPDDDAKIMSFMCLLQECLSSFNSVAVPSNSDTCHYIHCSEIIIASELYSKMVLEFCSQTVSTTSKIRFVKDLNTHLREFGSIRNWDLSVLYYECMRGIEAIHWKMFYDLFTIVPGDVDSPK